MFDEEKETEKEAISRGEGERKGQSMRRRREQMIEDGAEKENCGRRRRI
jgi:hypothetical protein